MTDEEAIKDFLIQQHKAGIDKSYEEIVEKLKFVKNDKKECQEMTDNEIIKALKCCISGKPCKEVKCPLYKTDCEPDLYALEKYALDLINRQQVEIERLTAERNAMHQDVKAAEEYAWQCKTAKSEAIKDFAERLKDYLRQQPQWYVIRENYKNVGFSYDDVFFGIEKVVKKITEANNE